MSMAAGGAARNLTPQSSAGTGGGSDPPEEREREKRSEGKVEVRTSTFNCGAPQSGTMSEELTRHCPSCGEERLFYRAASTEVHLGTKVKWHCPDCDYGFVRIDDSVDTGTA